MANADPSNTFSQRDLSVSHNFIGEVLVSQGDGLGALVSYRAGLAIVEPLAKADPSDTDWQRGLSIFHGNIGHVPLAQGDGPGALASYRAGLAIRERMAKADMTGWQRDLMLSHPRVGDTDGLGDGPEPWPPGSARIRALGERPTRATLLFQQGLTVSTPRLVAHLAWQGDRPRALASYQRSPSEAVAASSSTG